MDFLPWKRFHRIVARRNGDHYVKHFSRAEQFRVMAFAQLSYRESHKEGTRLTQTIQASEIKLAAIHHVDRPGLKRQLVNPAHVGHPAGREVNEAGDIAAQIEQRVRSTASTNASATAAGGQRSMPRGRALSPDSSATQAYAPNRHGRCRPITPIKRMQPNPSWPTRSSSLSTRTAGAEKPRATRSRCAASRLRVPSMRS